VNKEQQHKDYYKTPHWKKYIKELLDPDTCHCELCLAPRWKHFKTKPRRINRVFTIHHKHYNSLYKEKREDVQILCRRCHNLCHDILRMRRDAVFVADLQDVVQEYFTYEGGYGGPNS
jgi:hypothetical protein